MHLVFANDPTNRTADTNSDEEVAKVSTDSDRAASKTDSTDEPHFIVSLSDEQQLQAFAFMREHPFIWEKSNIKRFRKDRERRWQYWQKLADSLGTSCK